ncbi:hypothetical protein M413DRAFT_292826 [Hebeloma cylindrosporum]|uniref:WW domain-containing protein n=1 Tax=Hebeloma cylindrosporum TaxID=76867 RepID=A0A0C2YXT8_HEBCY|nr:hypothetical protein M413DRAFT_292826 [Hebeloma cylindrosporum h7]
MQNTQRNPENSDRRPLPEGWVQHYESSKQLWYYVQTNVTPAKVSFTHPADMTGPANRRFSTMPSPGQNPLAPMEMPRPTHTPAQPPRPQSSGKSFAQQLYASSGNKMAAPVISNHHITNLSTSVDAPHPHRVSSLPILPPPPPPPGTGRPNYYSNAALSPPAPSQGNHVPPYSNNLQLGTSRPPSANFSVNMNLNVGANLNSASSGNGTSASASVYAGFGANVHLPQRIQSLQPAPQVHTSPTPPPPPSQAHGGGQNPYNRPQHGHGFAHQPQQYQSHTNHSHAQQQQHHSSNSHPTNSNNGPRPTPHLLTVTRPPTDVNQLPSILQPTPVPAMQTVASPTPLSPLSLSVHTSPSSVSSASPPAHSLLFSQSPASNLTSPMTSPGLSPTSNVNSPISVTFQNGAPGANKPPSSTTSSLGGAIAAQAAMKIGGAVLFATTGIPAGVVSRVGSLLTDKRLIAMLRSAFSKNNGGVAESDLQAVLQGRPEANYQAILNALIRQQQLEQQQLMQMQAHAQTGM